ncbi:MAG: hypothetical protein K2G31_01130, partial [Clostridia bacterium]|nr:hypothetical protein [Clostridia bacterium]
MRKRSLSVILLLILVIVMTAGLVACDHKTVDGTLPDLNQGQGENPPPPIINDAETMGAQAAWKMLKDAALASAVQGNDSRYVSVDNSFVLGFDKDGFESVFVMRVAAAIDLLADSESDTSEILVELRQFLKSDLGNTASDSAALSKLAAEGKGELLTGMYYYEDKLVADLRGIKRAMNTEQEAVHVVYTENIDMVKLASGLYSVMQRLDISDVIFNQLFGYNLGEIIHNLIPLDFDLTVENIITKLLLGDANATLVEKGGGLQTLKIPCDLSLVASIIPLLQPLISVDIIDLVNKAVGLDLGKL